MKDLINVLAKDMGIVPYQDENLSYYKSRLIYSAICEWMRYATQDIVGEVSYSKSKYYILNRCSEILKAYLECQPECRSWFLDDSKKNDAISDTIRCIREKMIYAGELIEVGKHNHLTIPAYQEINCSLGYTRILGYSNDFDRINMIGITRIKQNNKDENNLIESTHIDIEEYINWSYEKGNWIFCDNINQFEFFDITSKKSPYQSWIEKPIKLYEKHIGRLTSFNGNNEYYLLKHVNGKWLYRSLERILQEYREDRRIIIGLKKIYENDMQAQFEYKTSVVILKLFCRLPLREEIILDTFAWPLRYYNDKLHYVIPYKIWDVIEKILINDIGIELKEKR